jgi:hypothetical protein
MKDFDKNAFATYSHMEEDTNMSTKSSESIKVYQPEVEAAWNTTIKLL